MSVVRTDEVRRPVPLGDLVGRVAHRMAREVERELAAAGLTIDQWRVLGLLADGAGHPMSEIAEHAMVPAPTLTKIVDRLTDSAMVYRRADVADRRRVLVLLSEHGRTVHDELAPGVAAAEDRMSGDLDAAERTTLRRLLERLAE
ncbi:MarR family transcriptional regulator [Pseudonocardia sp.]|uniref:MarR family winged helix-turn-helix transcriptional regulator n=1 Tax=Pseudonocardia sp. TaxID=60912 RepID=UPI002613823C|nr:MarR family transcriptional regulator [Pseudonocardia sp.]